MREQPKIELTQLGMLRAIADHTHVEGGPSKSWLAAELLRLRAEIRRKDRTLRELLDRPELNATSIALIKAGLARNTEKDR
jgi:hypothetical protein